MPIQRMYIYKNGVKVFANASTVGAADQNRIASISDLGMVKIGDGIRVDENGKISVDRQKINVASYDTAGIVRIGEGLVVTSEGRVSVDFDMVTPNTTTYIHDQTELSTEWQIQHNLGRFPSVTVIDSAGTELITGVQYVDENMLIVTANAPIRGKAYLN